VVQLLFAMVTVTSAIIVAVAWAVADANRTKAAGNRASWWLFRSPVRFGRGFQAALSFETLLQDVYPLPQIGRANRAARTIRAGIVKRVASNHLRGFAVWSTA
jgi:hypothetical protein